MKLKRVSLFLLLIILTGCVKYTPDKEKITTLVSEVFRVAHTETNTSAGLYNFYLPVGMALKEKKDINNIISYKGSKFYLYVNIVGFHYQTKYSYKLADNAFLKAKFNENSYLQIFEMGKDKYFVEMSYNYGKVEAIVDEAILTEAIVNMAVILNSIQYNEAYIKKTLDDKGYSSYEKIIDKFRPNSGDIY